MSSPIFDLNCPFCNRVYKLPRDKVVKHVGKTIFCRQCGKPFSVPPLPTFESNAGLLAVSERDLVSLESNESTATAVEAPPVETDREAESEKYAPPSAVDAGAEEQGYEETAHEAVSNGEVTETEPAEEKPIEESVAEESVQESAEDEYAIKDERPIGHAVDEVELPPPFAAETLPTASEVFAAADEPPSVNLSADVAHTPLEEVDPTRYLSSNEHGAVAISEDSTATFAHSYEVSTESLEIPELPETDEDEEAIAEREAFEETIRSEVEIAAPPPLPVPSPLPPPAAVPRRRPEQPVRVALPPGVSIDDVPVARAVSPVRPAPMAEPVNLEPLERKLARLTALVVVLLIMVVILLGVQAAEFLGYLPIHH